MASDLLGSMRVEIVGDNSKLDKSIDTSEKKTQGFSKSLKKLFTGIVVVAAVKQIGKVTKELIKAASEAEETDNKFKVVFQDISEEADKTAKNLSRDFGLSSNAAKTLLSDTGDLLTGFGFTGESALDLSKQVNELAVDLASFTNFSGGAEGASQALTKALLGERESVKSLGISILDTDVKAKVLELTQKGMVFETERQAKAYATLLIAQEQSKNAIGDFERSSASFANQTRITSARLEDLKVTLGDQLLPVANVGVGLFNDLLESTNGAAEGVGKFVESAEGVETISTAFGGIAGVFEVLKEFLVSLWIPLKDAIIKIVSPLGELETGTNKAGLAFSFLGRVTQLITGALEIYSTIVGGVVSNTVNLANTIKAAAGVVGDFFGLISGKTSLEEFKETIAETKDAFIDLTTGMIANSAESFTVLTRNVVDFFSEAKEGAADYEDAFKRASDNVEESVKASLTQTTETQKEALDEQAEQRAEAAEQELELYQETADERLSLQLDFEEELRDREERRKDQAKEDAQDLIDIEEEMQDRRAKAVQDVANLIQNIMSQRVTNARAAMEEFLGINGVEIESLEAKALTEEGLNEAEQARLNELNAEKKALAEEQYERELEAFKVGKAFKIAETIQTGANAAINAFNSLARIPYVGPILGGIAAGAVGVLTGVQVGLIASQSPPPRPAFAEGGIVAGTSFVGDKVPIAVNSGELVANQEQKDRALMSFLNGESQNNNRGRQSNAPNQPIVINAMLDKKVLFKVLYDGSKQGKLLTASRSVV